jgi:hypothetical protein
MRLKSLYDPRPHFMGFHLRPHRWSVLVAHRRAGKTVAAINDVIEKATRNTRPNPRYAYVAPLLRQAKDIAWMYLKEYAAPFKPKISESALYVELTALPNNPRITLYGADNPDSFRGLYLDGVILDEFGDMVGSIFQEILLPALIDRRGWAVFMGTPKGPNHFRDMFYDRREDSSWSVFFLPVTATDVIPEDALAEMKKLMDDEQYAQEMLCSFEASVRGAIYARQVEEMEKSGRVGDFPLERENPTDVVMDLGFRDLSTIGFVQSRPDGLLMGHAHGENMKPISHYIKYIKEYINDNGLRMGQIWLPHDARAKSLQTGKSIIENFRDASLRPKIVPQLDLLDGIAASRKMFPYWYINERECKQLVLALKTYHREYDEKTKVYKDTPVHDWSSHYTDMWRYANIVQNPKDITTYVQDRKKDVVKPVARAIHYGFKLDDIWDLGPRPMSSRL